MAGVGGVCGPGGIGSFARRRRAARGRTCTNRSTVQRWGGQGVGCPEPPTNPAPIRVALLFATLLIGSGPGVRHGRGRRRPAGHGLPAVPDGDDRPGPGAGRAGGTLQLALGSGRPSGRGRVPCSSRPGWRATGRSVVAAAVELRRLFGDAVPVGRLRAIVALAAFGVLGIRCVLPDAARHRIGCSRARIGLAGSWVVGPILAAAPAGLDAASPGLRRVRVRAVPLAAFVVTDRGGPDDPLSAALAAQCRFGAVADGRRRAARRLGGAHAGRGPFHHAARAEDVPALVGPGGRLQPRREPLSRRGPERLVRPLPRPRRLHGERRRIRPRLPRRPPRFRGPLRRLLRARSSPAWPRAQGAGYVLAPRPPPDARDERPARSSSASRAAYAIYRVDPARPRLPRAGPSP